MKKLETGMRGGFRVVGVVAVWLVVGGAGGCTFARPERKMNPAVQSQRDVFASSDQVRLRVRAMVGPACGVIERTADEIAAEATDASVRQAALRWKIEGVPAMRAALFQPDPYTAQFDSWVLSFQMIDFYETGPGKALMGEASGKAVVACRGLEEEMNRVAASMTKSGDVSKGRAFAKQWARSHPIRQSISDRESTLSRVLERDGTGALSAGQAVAEITTTVDDLNRRIEIYSGQLFRQARWEVELFKSELMADLPVAEMMALGERAVSSAERAAKSADQAVGTLDRLAPVVAGLDRLVPAVERAVGAAETMPKMIASEREFAIKAVQEELGRLTKFVSDERTAALEHLGNERATALRELHQSLKAEREAMTKDLAVISMQVVDHAFWRAAQLVAAVVVVSAVGLFVGVAFLVRTQKARA